MSASRYITILMSLLVAMLVACSDDESPTETSADAAIQEDPDAGDKTADAAKDDPKPTNDDPNTLPIVFAHGFAGSASQFDSQAQRFVANGYPAERLFAYDHDGQSLDIVGFVNGLDQVIDEARTKFNTSQVYLIGHSRGTLVATTYLADVNLAKKISKVIMLDGAPCLFDIPCDAPNQSNLPGQAHVEVATSADSFKRQYKFLFGKDPEVVDIVKQDGPVEISGRAVNFPANTGRDGAELTIYEIDDKTGARVGEPVKKFTIPADGSWGPLTVNPDKRYEMQLSSEAGGFQHFYFDRFLRSTKFVRLLSGPADSPSRLNINSSPNHATITAIRMREWFPTDVLKITTKSSKGEKEVANANMMNAGRDRIALYLHDDKATPEESSLQPLPWFPMQPFQTGFDVYMPAADPPDGTISIVNHPRGDADKAQTINVPNWASDNHMIMVMFNDYAQ